MAAPGTQLCSDPSSWLFSLIARIDSTFHSNLLQYHVFFYIFLFLCILVIDITFEQRCLLKPDDRPNTLLILHYTGIHYLHYLQNYNCKMQKMFSKYFLRFSLASTERTNSKTNICSFFKIYYIEYYRVLKTSVFFLLI